MNKIVLITVHSISKIAFKFYNSTQLHDLKLNFYYACSICQFYIYKNVIICYYFFSTSL